MYTIGIKRRYWPGYRKVKVTGHDYQNGRFILNCEDGSQEHIPGFSTPLLRVYPDFWTHISRIEREKARQQAELVASRPVAPRPEPVAVRAPEPEPELEPEPLPEPPDIQEVKRRAADRVYRILQGNA